MEGKKPLDKQANDNVTALTDNYLLEQTSQGDIASFEALFHRHYDRVYGLLFRLVGNRPEAEDLTQEVFLKLYDHAFGGLFLTGSNIRSGSEQNVSAWLYRVATNSGYNAIRGRKRRWQRDTVLVPDESWQLSAEEDVERSEEAEAVRDALQQLKPKQVQLLLLRQMGMSYAELAAACKVAPGSVGTLLSRAAEAFRQAYPDETGDSN